MTVDDLTAEKREGEGSVNMDEQAKITRVYQPVTIELNGVPWEGNVQRIHMSHDGKTASVDLMSREEFQKMLASVMIDPDEVLRG